MKKTCAMLLCLALLLSVLSGAVLAEQSAYPDYLNLDAPYPMVKDGYDVTLSMAYVTSSSYASAETCLFFKMFDQLLNIKLDLQPIDSSAVDERTNLMFASGDVPDMLLGFGFGANTILQYGVQEGQLLAVDPYINEDITPNIMAAIQDYPQLLTAMKAPDGKNYFVPRLLSADSPGDNANICVAWLDALELESPRTLDEFLDVMRKFKEADVDGHGSENVFPMGGAVGSLNPFAYILNAMGYNMGYSWAGTTSGSGLSICERDGVVGFPCNDELFYEFLKIAKTCYDEGLISPNFFTMDGTQVNAMAAEGVFGFVCEPMHVLFSDPKDFQRYYQAYPLTSEWNEKAQVPATFPYDKYAPYFSAATEYPELCLRWNDIWYGDYCYLLWYGPAQGSPEAEIMGVDGWHLPEDGNAAGGVIFDGQPSSYQYTTTTLVPGNFQYGRYETGNSLALAKAGNGFYEPLALEDYDLTQGGMWSGHGQMSVVAPFMEMETTYPSFVYRTDEVTQAMADYNAVINPYVKEQVAMFVTGKRELTEDEFAKYLGELEAMGMNEYEKLYQDEWDAYQAGLAG